jgi:methylthioribose-1-phosphate isomerase
MQLPPLAWPAHDEGDVFYILDETKLPEEKVYIKADSYLDAARAISGMQTRAFGQVLTLFYAFLITARQNRDGKPEEVLSLIRTAARALEQSRPTFAFKDLSGKVMAWAERAFTEEKDISSFLEEHILVFLDHLKELRIRRANCAATLIGDGDVVLTHCNVSGEMVLIGRACREAGKSVRFYATETRPYFQGRLTAWELAGDGFDVTMVPDSAVAGLLCEHRCQLVMVGSDRVALNGDIVNKVGTFQLAVAARTFGVPFYALVQEPGAVARGEDIPVEERDEQELLTYRGKRVYPEDVRGYYPAFDLTPAAYITRLITFGGIIEPGELPQAWQKMGKMM